MNKERFQYCPSSSDIVIQGTRDSAVMKKSHAYVIYEILKCTDEVRESVGQETKCADQDSINNWFR